MYENIDAYLLGAVGFARGVYEIYVRDGVKDNPALAGWGVMGAYILAFDLLSPQTLSNGCHRALEKHPVLTTAAVGGVALHLLNKL